MKRAISLILAVLLVLAACGVAYADDDVCACGLDCTCAETAEKPSAQVVPSSYTGVWNVKAFLDEFDLPTGDYYVVNDDGFDSTYTSSNGYEDDDYFAYITYEQNDIGNTGSFYIRLYNWWYGSDIFDDGWCSITVVDNDGDKINIEGVQNEGSNRLLISDDSSEALFSVLEEGGDVRILITEQGNGDQYLIVIEDATGFTNAVAAMKNE